MEAMVPRPKVMPLSAQWVGPQVTLSQNTYAKLRRSRALLSHQIPSGDVAEVLDRVLDLANHQLEKGKFAPTENPRPKPRATTSTRHIPAHVKRAVWERDQGQCTFTSEAGRRCASTDRLEFDHVDPVARGGRATVEGIRLRCRAHNQYEAERMFGTEFMNNKRERAREAADARAAAEARAQEAARNAAAGASAQAAAREHAKERDVVPGSVSSDSARPRHERRPSFASRSPTPRSRSECASPCRSFIRRPRRTAEQRTACGRRRE